MKFITYLKDKVLIIIVNILMMVLLSLYLLAIGNNASDIFLIIFVWIIMMILSLFSQYYRRRKFLEQLLYTCESLEERYLIIELMDKPQTVEDIIYQRVLRLSNKSMIEKITRIQSERKEYKEFVEQWVHEIKTPLAAMKLICGNNKSSTSQKFLEELERTEGYVEQALFYARSETAEKDYLVQEISLEEVVADTLRGNKRLLLNQQVSVTIDCPHLVFTDEKWILFILNQLIVNAVKYQATSLQFNTKKIRNGIILSVRDNGIGISEEDISRIFDKGFTGENGRKFNKSTGIGLYLCKRLCEQLGLGINVSSKKGDFTEVKLVFPIGDFMEMEEE